MSLILNIDTSTQQASICLSLEGKALSVMENDNQKDHAAWLHTAIEKLLKQEGYPIDALDAVSVTEGPGSYTGLRVGLATAKGLCYALGIPLITENTLMVMAFAAKLQKEDPGCFFCPMIDARRMEVFTALYNQQLEPVMSPAAIVLEEAFLSEELQINKLLFFGDGSKKWQNICKSPNAFFPEIKTDAGHLGILADRKFKLSQFTDIIYSNPAYIKNFHTYPTK